MRRSPRNGPGTWILLSALLPGVAAPEPVLPPTPVLTVPAVPPCIPGLPVKPLPINLPTALKLGNARGIDIALASARVQAAAAELNRARALWLPSIQIGVDYFRHDGRIQDSSGNILDNSHGAFMVGAAPNAVFAFSDALYAPLAARQVMRAREAEVQAAANDTFLAVAQAYFTAQQARGDLAGAQEATRRGEELLRRLRELATALVPEVEISRARADLSRLRQAAFAAQERWRLASADLVRILRMEPSALVQPLEPPELRVCLVGLDRSVDDLIPVALTTRPELASRQALVQATLQLLRQERIRPLVPSLLLRGASTNPTGTLAGGVFGGGPNGSLNNFGMRSDIDVQLIWQLDNLGFGNRARVRAREADNQAAVLELFRVQDLVAAEVVQAHAQVQLAAARVAEAEEGLKAAIDSADKNLLGLGQTKRVGDLILLVIRPQEVVASIDALNLAYGDYFAAVGDFNRAQFRLYRALGHPAQDLLGDPHGLGSPADLCPPATAVPPSRIPSVPR